MYPWNSKEEHTGWQTQRFLKEPAVDRLLRKRTTCQVRCCGMAGMTRRLRQRVRKRSVSAQQYTRAHTQTSILTAHRDTGTRKLTTVVGGKRRCHTAHVTTGFLDCTTRGACPDTHASKHSLSAHMHTHTHTHSLLLTERSQPHTLKGGESGRVRRIHCGGRCRSSTADPIQ